MICFQGNYSLVEEMVTENHVGYRMQLIFIIHGFHVCGFVYSLKFVYNPKVNVCGAFKAIKGHGQIGKILTLPDVHTAY